MEECKQEADLSNFCYGSKIVPVQLNGVLHPSYMIPDPSHTRLLLVSERGVPLRQSDVTPLRCRGVKPCLSGGDVKFNPIHSALHSISCNCTKPMLPVSS